MQGQPQPLQMPGGEVPCPLGLFSGGGEQQEVVGESREGDLGPVQGAVEAVQVEVAEQGRQDRPLGDTPVVGQEAAYMGPLVDPARHEAHGLAVGDEAVQHT